MKWVYLNSVNAVQHFGRLSDQDLHYLQPGVLQYMKCPYEKSIKQTGIRCLPVINLNCHNSSNTFSIIKLKMACGFKQC